MHIRIISGLVGASVVVGATVVGNSPTVPAVAVTSAAVVSANVPARGFRPAPSECSHCHGSDWCHHCEGTGANGGIHTTCPGCHGTGTCQHCIEEEPAPVLHVVRN